MGNIQPDHIDARQGGLSHQAAGTRADIQYLLMLRGVEVAEEALRRLYTTDVQLIQRGQLIQACTLRVVLVHSLEHGIGIKLLIVMLVNAHDQKRRPVAGVELLMQQA
ncbi:hypothetical protein GCM10009109_07470 [Marinobacterium sediminicola]